MQLQPDPIGSPFSGCPSQTGKRQPEMKVPLGDRCSPIGWPLQLPTTTSARQCPGRRVRVLG